MTAATPITLYHAPNTRSTAVRVLLEELGLPHTVRTMNRYAGDLSDPAFLAINPLGKVPTVTHGTAVMTEQVAIFVYLADIAPVAGLAPALDDPLRGPYLRWLVYYAASFEPAVIDRVLKREPGPVQMSPYGTYEAMMAALLDQLGSGPFLLGDRFLALDLLWGRALWWTVKFGAVEATPEITAYVDRVMARPANQRVDAADAALAKEHEKTAPAP